MKVDPDFTKFGAWRVKGFCTSIGAVPVTPFTVTSIVATPGARMVTIPASLTVATSGLLLV